MRDYLHSVALPWVAVGIAFAAGVYNCKERAWLSGAGLIVASIVLTVVNVYQELKAQRYGDDDNSGRL